MDLNVSPYFDDGKEQYKNNYKQVLFKPGVPLQAREVTQLQTLTNEQLKENLNMLYSNGSIIQGIGEPSIVGTTASILPGKYYFDGRIHDVEAQTINVVLTGEQKLGFDIVEEVVTSAGDTTLNDPASGYPNYDLPGADRLKQTIVFVNITESGSITAKEQWTLLDGEFVQGEIEQEYSAIGDVLARRTFDESGHYLVDGMICDVIKYEPEGVSTDELKIQVSDGNAYVKGYEVKYTAPDWKVVNKSQTTDSVLSEPKTYLSGTSDYTLNQMYVDTTQTVKVSGEVKVSRIRIVHGSINGTDNFTDANTTTTYNNIVGSSVIVSSSDDEVQGPWVEGTDYNISGDTIDWSPAATEPASGESYYVTFRYVKNLVRDTDFEINSHASIADAYVLTFLAGDKPVSGTQINIDYSYYLARTDLIMIDRFGEIIINSGEPAHVNETIIPNGSPDYLTLAWVKIMPNLPAAEAVVYNYNYKRLTMMDLFNLRNRVSDVEYNQAELALEADAKGSELPTNLKGIFVDGFETFERCDTENVAFKCALNSMTGELTKRIEYENPTISYANDARNNISLNLENFTRYAGLTQIGEKVSISLTGRTGVENLNPYEYLLTAGTADINPRLDFWIDTEINKFVRSRNVVTRVNATTQINVTNTGWWNNWNSRWVRTRTTDTVAGTSVSRQLLKTNVRTTRRVQDQTIAFARRIPIEVFGADWDENSRIDVFFDGELVSATPTNGTTSVTDAQGTHLVVKVDGTFQGTIMVPANTRTGAHELSFRDIDLSLSTSAIFTSRGIDRLITETDFITRNFQENRVTTVNRTVNRFRVDPISQSFKFKNAKTLTGIDLFFKSRADDGTPAWMEMGYMVNGYPSNETVFLHQTIRPGDVNIHVNGLTPTRINFDKPIYIAPEKEFFITFGSASPEYNVYTSELGKRDINTGVVVDKNPYVQGVFFKSSNNRTWTAFQNMDLSCILYEGIYDTVGSITTESVAGLTNPIQSFIFNADEIIPADGSLTYYYAKDGGEWRQFKPGLVNMLDSLGTNLRFKIDFTGNGSVTPLVNVQSYSVVTTSFNTDADNYYITRQITNIPAFNNIRIIYDRFLPAGCTETVQYSIDGSNWFDINDGEVDEGYVDQQYQRVQNTRNIVSDSLSNATQIQFRILLSGGGAFDTPYIKNFKTIMKV